MKKIKTINDMLYSHLGDPFVIIGAGGNVKKYRDRITSFIKETNAITIGINNIFNFGYPTYHLWTNTGRIKEFGNKIDTNKTKLMLGCHLSDKIRSGFYKDYVLVKYSDKKGESIRYKNGRIYGFYRTAGCLAIVIAHLLGASSICVVGMDGYTLNSKEEVFNGIYNQHLYSRGFSDLPYKDRIDFEKKWENCIHKDQLVYQVLNSIYDYGAKFSIITPTKFEKFFDTSVLGI